MAMPASFTSRVIAAARSGVESEKRIIYYVGTHEEDKGRAGSLAFLHQAGQDRGNYLVRVYTLRNDLEDLTFGKGLKELLGASRLARWQKDRVIEVNGSRIYLDSMNTASQRKTPYQIKGALLLPFCTMHGKPGREGEILDEMAGRGAKRLVLVSCVDDKDDAWIVRHDPEVIILNETDAERHNRVFGIFGDRFKSRWYGPV